jgi:predicted ribosome quality control (RQC) complex YloA/Tae2 family protein
MARGNDIFLHVSGRPGAHVIIRTIPGKTVPRDTLLEAGQLALYYSLGKRSGAVFVEGAAAEVDYTPAKLVSKPKGAPPGLVMLSRHKTLRIRLEREIFERIGAGS